MRPPIACTCDDEFRRTHYSHRSGCPLEAALDATYVRGWEEGQADAGVAPTIDPRILLRIWAS